MSQHHKSLHRAYMIITTLEPLGPEASPGAKTRFRETAKLCRLYAGQMLTHISGVCEASEISSDEDEITKDIKQPNIIKETAAFLPIVTLSALVVGPVALLTRCLALKIHIDVTVSPLHRVETNLQ